MKNGLSTPALLRISHALSQVLPHFNAPEFLHYCQQGLEALELKARVNHIINGISAQCPNFTTTAPALMQLPQHWDAGTSNDPLRGFAAWPIIDYVAAQGLNEPQLAFAVLEQLTPLFSAEFAIRPFIDTHPTASFKQLQQWAKHPNEHLRRLASEGCRPRLPWGMQLKALVSDPSPIFAILDQLMADPSLYVRKSVANNLNDIGKDHPNTLLDYCEKWQATCAPSQKNAAASHTQWIIKHACRNLIKAGNVRCLSMLGFGHAKISQLTLGCNPQTSPHQALNFTAQFTANCAQPLVIDYAIDFMRKNNQHNRKVFKLKTFHSQKGQTININKSYSFKPITTRQYYEGEHFLHLQINGNIVASVPFSYSPVNP